MKLVITIEDSKDKEKTADITFNSFGEDWDHLTPAMRLGNFVHKSLVAAKELMESKSE